ncbi:MAG: alternative ribosome rescue aminoacyl-tRNA hydrolase ArfB [Gemmatimonadota bacterium]
MSESSIPITPDLSLPVAELNYRASRSGGPGGQHVNTSSTRIELVWDVAGSPSLTPEQRDRLQEKLANRISGEGLLTLASATSRSQHRNREEVTERFVEIVRDALHVPKKRKKTRPSRASKERRLKAKKQRAQKKKLRGSVPLD